jgi:hypothetical protein
MAKGACGVNAAGAVGTERFGIGGAPAAGGTETGEGMPDESCIGDAIDTVDSPPPSSSSGNSFPRCGSAILTSPG